MKRKLISFDVFKKIEESSLSTAQNELIGAEEVLAKTLSVDDLKLRCFGESDVTYQSPDGNLVHANYEINKDQLILDNIENLIIDDESEDKHAKQIISNMVEAIIEDNKAKASDQLNEYLSLPVVKREFINEDFSVTTSKPSGKRSKLFGKKQDRSLVNKRIREMKKTKRKLASAPSLRKTLAKKRANAAHKLGGSKNPRWRTYARKIKHMKEWVNLCENTFDYLDYKEFGPTLKESFVKTDEQGNVVGVKMPTLQKRNEGKILSFNWKTLDHEVKILRGKMKKLAENINFCKAMAELNRYNNVSDAKSVNETIEKITKVFPNLIYLTQTELAEQIGKALEVASVKKFDDGSCNFLAEGILRMAHEVYSDRVRKIANLAGMSLGESEDPYIKFSEVCAVFYPRLDEADKAELRVFADLHKSLVEVYKVATEISDATTRDECASYLRGCEAVLNRDVDIDLDLAESIANYLYDILENVEGASQDWNVSSDAHISVNGSHPQMEKIAKVGDAVANKQNDNWDDPAPVSDGKSYKNGLADEMRNNAWGNWSDNETFDGLSNPNVPKSDASRWKIKEKDSVVDDESSWSRWQGDSTWRDDNDGGLSNPNVKESPWKSAKMKSDNLVVDK